MPKKMRVPDIENHIRSTLDEVSAEISRSSYALFGLDTLSRPDLYASCVLLECDGVPVLVTAAHAICEIEKTGRGIHLGAKSLTQLPDQFCRSSACGRDPLDIAGIVIPQDLLRAEEMHPLPFSRTTFARSFPEVNFRCVHGYPCTKNKQRKQIDYVRKTFTRHHFTFAGVSPAAFDYRGSGKDDARHIALQYRMGTNEKGNRGLPPDPRGMSGGGLGIVPDVLVAKTPYLEGIAIEYHRSKSLVFSTRIDHVIDFVRRQVLAKG